MTFLLVQFLSQRTTKTRNYASYIVIYIAEIGNHQNMYNTYGFSRSWYFVVTTTIATTLSIEIFTSDADEISSSGEIRFVVHVLPWLLTNRRHQSREYEL